MKNLFLKGFLILSLFPSSLHAQSLINHWFWPGTSLPGEAATGLLPLTDPIPEDWNLFAINPAPIRFNGMMPTETSPNILTGEQVPDESFSVEFWVLDHVNQPVGVVAYMREGIDSDCLWGLAYHARTMVFHMRGIDHPLEAVVGRGFKKYFYHIAITADGDMLRLYVNGVEQDQAPQPEIDLRGDLHIDLAAYLDHEPWMKIGHLLKLLRIEDQALSQESIAQRYEALCQMVEEGHKLPDQFHMTAGPYLFRPTQQGIEILWESNHPATASVNIGTDANHLATYQTLDCPEGLGHVIIEGLEAESRYFYEIDLINEQGQQLSSGILSFQTAVTDSAAWSFAVCGDPEARPHVNQRLSELVWEERPNFLLNLGDLTDGGKAPHLFEWTYEYFSGMGALHQRIPSLPVAGNGESDLVWYWHYHGMESGSPAYYSYTYGNAQFFILNSNERDELAPGGIQYEWLEHELAASTATWKFVAHHHAPFSSDENDYGNAWENSNTDLGDLQVRELVPLYEQYGVDIVFFGHLHTYERTWPIRDLKVDPEYGVVYLVSGGAGGNLEDFSPTRSWFTTKLYRGHHYSRIDIFEGKLYFKMYDLHGALKDYMELEK